jgi:hypothetical protein
MLGTEDVSPVVFHGRRAGLSPRGWLRRATARGAQGQLFPGSSNLPLLAAIGQGFFARRGLTIEVQNTPNSESQRAGPSRRDGQVA